MIPFWWACCTARQTGTNSSSRSRIGSRCLVAVLGDRDALDQLHDEVGAAGVGGAGVEDAGDVGVVHQGQGLALGLEAGDDLLRVHARLDDLQGHRAADRLGLLGHVDDAHAPLADLLQQLVGADHGMAGDVDLERIGRLNVPGLRRPELLDGLGQRTPRPGEMGRQEPLDLQAPCASLPHAWSRNARRSCLLLTSRASRKIARFDWAGRASRLM